jgi:ABC-type lipoprotein export system ATPase subunit
VTPSDPLLVASGIGRSFRRGAETVVALEGLDLTLEAGELVALVGPSGSGKTTLLNVLCGWELPDTGSISWKGRDGVALDSLGWSEIALVPQSAGLLEELTIAENAGLAGRLAVARTPDGQREQAARLDELLAALGLTQLSDRLPKAASMGEQQRAAVARALLRQPSLVLADEPTAHQDAGFSDRVMAAFAAATAAGSCCVIATHSADVMARADRVVRLVS